ncbi:hypothetical protein TWF694_007931 [Orbilia ellipsospora]|uniref:Uncharacterized protein n=1 Tax=Orbilia ellipsospora TaxID=2528407 RepID=A0AAV9XMK7_9PEZI
MGLVLAGPQVNTTVIIQSLFPNLSPSLFVRDTKFTHTYMNVTSALVRTQKVEILTNLVSSHAALHEISTNAYRILLSIVSSLSIHRVYIKQNHRSQRDDVHTLVE